MTIYDLIPADKSDMATAEKLWHFAEIAQAVIEKSIL